MATVKVADRATGPASSPATAADRGSPATARDDSRPRLSLCMIVRDEEKRLGRCLDSVAGLVDEIVVVDTGSRDGTRALAQQYGARLADFAWCDDFAAARNRSLELATGDWIMWLDADDVLPSNEHAKIRHLLSRGQPRGYFFVLDDQGYERVSCLQLRLFPNRPGVEFELPVHEQVTPSLTRLGISLVPTDIRVLHTGYPTVGIVKAKKERYLAIMERWLVAHPDNYIVRSHVALIYHTTGQLRQAEEEYRRIIYDSRCLAERNYVVYTTALLFLGRTYLKLGDLDAALHCMRWAEREDPDYVLTRLSLAEVLVRRAEYDLALPYALSVPATGRQPTFFPLDYDEMLYSAHILAGQAYQGREELSRAEHSFRQAAQVPVPRRSQALGLVSELCQQQGNNVGARQALEEARTIDPGNLQHLFNLGALLLNEGELEQAEACFAAVVQQDPEQTPARLNMGYIARKKNDFARAETLYREALEHDLDGVEARANLAHLLLEQERYAEAGAWFEQVRQRRAELLDIDLGLLVVQAVGGDAAAAHGLASEIIARFPDIESEMDSASGTARTLLRLGAELLRRNLARCAELALLAAAALDADARAAHRALGELYYTRGVYWQAISRFEMLLQAHPGDAVVFGRLGDCYERLGVAAAARMCRDQQRQLGG